MKLMKRLMCAALAAAALLSSAPAFAAEAPKTASIWIHSIYIDGRRGSCRNSDNLEMYHLSYNNAVYTAVHTAAEWMGKDMIRSSDGKTITLSGSKAPVFHSDYADCIYTYLIAERGAEAFHAKVAEPIPVKVLTDTKLVLDGTEKPTTIIDRDGVPFIPIRTVAEMMGMDIKYASADYGRQATIYLRTPLTDAELKACQDYLAAVSSVSTCLPLWGSINTYKTVEDFDKALEQALGYMNLYKSTPKPDCRLMSSRLQEADQMADEAILACNTVRQMIKDGADRDTIYFVSGVDWKTIPPAETDNITNGALALCAHVASMLSALNSIVYETP